MKYWIFKTRDRILISENWVEVDCYKAFYELTRWNSSVLPHLVQLYAGKMWVLFISCTLFVAITQLIVCGKELFAIPGPCYDCIYFRYT